MTIAFANKKSRQIGAALTAIGGYSVPAATVGIVTSVMVSNTTGAAILVDVTVYDGVNDYYLVKGASLSSGGSLVAVGSGERLILNANESIRVYSNTATSADAVMSLVEQS